MVSVGSARGGPEPVTIRAASPADFPELGRILWAAFGGKMRPFLGDRPGRNAALLADLFAARGLAPESARVAADARDKPLGVCLLRQPGVPYAALGPIARTALRHFGLWGGLRAFLGLCLFDERLRADTCVISLLAVAPEARGRGVGGALLGAAEAEALGRGLGRLALDVIEDNPAKSLYLRRGFRTTRTHRVPAPLARLFGFSRFDHMEKPLAARCVTPVC